MNREQTGNKAMPVLVPMEQEEFWTQVRRIIREEISHAQKSLSSGNASSLMETPGLTQKPLYRFSEVCALFSVSRPTVYQWIKDGRLRRVKIRSKVYFLGADVQQMVNP